MLSYIFCKAPPNELKPEYIQRLQEIDFSELLINEKISKYTIKDFIDSISVFGVKKEIDHANTKIGMDKLLYLMDSDKFNLVLTMQNLPVEELLDYAAGHDDVSVKLFGKVAG